MKGKLLGVLAALAICSATTGLSAGRSFGGGMRGFGVPHVGGGFGVPRVGGGFVPPRVGVGGGFTAPHLSGRLGAPPPGGGFGAPRVGGGSVAPRLGGHDGMFTPGGRPPGGPVLGNPGLRHYTFHHHHRYRRFFYAPVGLGWLYYDGCWRRTWTVYGWNWTNVCYVYPAASRQTARRSCANASNMPAARHCKPGRQRGARQYRSGSSSKGH